MAISNWMIPRPKRDVNPTMLVQLVSLMDSLCHGQAFSKDLQAQFTEAIKQAGINASVARVQDSNSGGARTYYALLSALGLMFKQEGKVYPTIAGETLITGKETTDVLRRQLARFQYPSPYSRSVRIDPSYNVRPFVFLLQLLEHPDLGGYFTDLDVIVAVVCGVSNWTETVDQCVSLITKRRNGSPLEDLLTPFCNLVKIAYLKDIANTFTNYMRSASLITAIEREAGAQSDSRYQFTRITDDSIPSIQSMLSEPLLTDSLTPEQQQRRFGRYNRERDNRRLSDSSGNNWKLAAIDAAILKQMRVSLGDEWINSFVTEYAAKLQIPVDIVDKRTAIARRSGREPFEQNYLNLSVGGTSCAEEFEKMTAIVLEQLGFNTTLTGRKRRRQGTGSFADVYFEIPSTDWASILDCKSTSQYSLPHNHIVLMDDYISVSKTDLLHEGYELKTVGYVSGGFTSNIDNRLKEITARTNVPAWATRPQWLLKQLDIAPDIRLEQISSKMKAGGHLV